ncbi:LacI family DNA-binding transcriptional regulator [Mediterraneibacter sp. NSJ-55]|uniref:LacI family DNA-binding transcriptional regulator n=1 Tax=Mediterraneibacter hominis TaxID=2763054 RepID=A0A923LJN7_9FIRM|nr:LacI family DNA-binding transcriptional regulator [Mediterraneibacter hominis]
MKTKMTIEDIASKAGVGIATVSRVLNNRGYVSEKTRAKIEEVIKNYDYVPSATARNFAKKESNMVAVIVPEAHNPYFAAAVEGISEILEQQELLLILCNSDKDSAKEEKILYTLKQQELKGIIVTPAIDDLDKGGLKEYKEIVESLYIPVVFMDSGLNFYEWDVVYFDNIANSYNAIKAAIEDGSREIGIITGDLQTKTARDRYKGYVQALEENGIDINEKYVYHGDFTVKTAYNITRKMLSKGKYPEIVFTSNNLTTIGFIKAVYDAKLKLGRDIHCISFDKLDTFEELKYSYIERNPLQMGRLAATMLMERIKEPELPARKYYMKSKIIVNINR